MWSRNSIYGQSSDIGPGTIVDVECIDEKVHKAEICKLPMYDPKGEIVRGINKDIPNMKPEALARN